MSYTEPMDLGAPYTSNNEAHGVDLAEPLNKLQCRVCGHTVAGLEACAECERRKKEAEEAEKKRISELRKATK